ncbi:hypothetical protein G4B88_021681 [Cannabis sativa]|uniref:Uncharacterized protein n=1 Tax=Cannabis sativa TaxID=3483 RepID=A0A7J6GJ80_CANSA|nr:hypothetical protein G4B88_021681 [Cannabis sativa]
MKSLLCTSPITCTITPSQPSNPNSKSTTFAFASPSPNFFLSSLQFRALNKTLNQHLYKALTSHSAPEEEEPDAQVEDLRVPDQWLPPSRALEVGLEIEIVRSDQFVIMGKFSNVLKGVVMESEWLRVTLHKWLDDEYCPEPTNVEISKVASYSYYKCLIEGQTDLGEILLKMARELETISYQESFHGAFSSANAAINLIAQRIDHPHLS